MCKFNCIGFSFFLVFSMTAKCSRKYDINEEAQTIYHTDVKTILQMFRRTPEYLKILDDKRQALEESMRDAKMHLYFIFLKKLETPLKEMFDVNTTTTPVSDQSTAQGGKTTISSALKAYLVRRQNEPEHEKGVKVLDEYSLKISSSKLTPAQRQHAKDLGFEYTGKIIHALIKTLGKDDDTPADSHSTKMEIEQVQSNGKSTSSTKTTTTTTTTTTEHNHVVTSTTEPTYTFAKSSALAVKQTNATLHANTTQRTTVTARSSPPAKRGR